MLAGLMPWALLAGLGLGTGILGSLTGAGGGFLLVPILLLLYPSDSVTVVTSISLAVVFLNALSGTIAYTRLGRIDWGPGSLFAVASVPAAVAGALATKLLPRGPFDLGFGILLILLAGYLAFRARVVEGTTRPSGVDLPKGAVLSAAIGFVSSLSGIGGGFIQVPMLTQVLGYPVLIATAMSQYILTFMALTGTMTHIVSGEFDQGIRRTIALGFGVLIGAQIGARLSSRVNVRWVVRALAAGLACVGLRLALSVVL